MNLTMSLGHRKRAEQLIHATAKDGADATAQLLRHFPPDVLPALVAYLARVAVDARVGGGVSTNQLTRQALISRSRRRVSGRFATEAVAARPRAGDPQAMEGT